MKHFRKPDTGLLWILLFSLAALTIHLMTYDHLGLHRDEFLYLALGRHLSAGYWSNPPFIGFIAFISQHLPVNSFLAARIIPALGGASLIFLTGLITRELGGKMYAQILVCIAIISSILFLRTYSMLMPVPFDILFWTLVLYFFLRYVKTKKNIYLLVIGIFFGFGMLNKYMIAFLAAGILLATLFTPHRILWGKKHYWFAIGIAFLIFLPNLAWQVQNQFPVIYHMKELVRTQLIHVQRMDIIVDQLLMFFGSSVIWIGGLIWLLANKRSHPFRIFGYLFLCVLGMVVLLRGKSYYTAGLYPFYFAAGAVFWEGILKKNLVRTILISLIVILNLPLVPGGIPLMNKASLSEYFKGMYKSTGIDALLRWEDGRLHALPQDYADRLGWEELGSIVNSVYDTINHKSSLFVFCENYGEAGAVEYYASERNLQVVSFSDSYILWVPETIAESENTFLYVNDEVGNDVDSLFMRIDSVSGISDIFAREYGTTVFLLREPEPGFYAYWSDKVHTIKGTLLP